MDGCSIGEDGLILCRRHQAPQAGFVCFGPATGDSQWTLYRRENDHCLQNRHLLDTSANGHSADHSIDWRARAERFAGDLKPEREIELAAALGLPVVALGELPLLGFCLTGPHKDESGNNLGVCWTFPEVDAAASVIGLICRYRNGQKKAWPQGKRGLTLPDHWRERSGPILVPEGQSDTLALVALSVSGVGRPSNMGGVEHLCSLLRDIPADRTIVVLGERDPNDKGQWPGREGAVKTARELSTKLGRPVKWALPPDGAKDVREWVRSKNLDPTCADMWHDSGQELLNGIRILDVEGDSTGTEAERVASQQCRIDATHENLPALTEQAWSAICANNEPPTLFRYSSVPSRIEKDDEGAPLLRIMTIDRMRHRLARDADWFVVDRGGKEKAAAPPLSIVRDVLATPDPELPILTRIVEVPIFASNGSLCSDAGYNHNSRSYYSPAPGFTVPNVSPEPSAAEINSARDFLAVDLLGDFPFVGDAERAHAIAALLGPLVRNMIDGPTPLHSIEAPSPGTGKTLLTDMLSFPALGRPIAPMTEGRDEDEWRKRIFAKLRAAPTVVLLDNIKRRLDSGALASAITSYPLWEDRVLGVSEMARVPVLCTWLLTGNNPAFSSEMMRRTVRIRLDAKVDRPWLREGFRHPDLRAWAAANRGKLVWASLTLVQAWIAAGMPGGRRTLGMFERWAKIIGGIFDVVGIRGFLGNLADFYETSDADGSTLRALIGSWWTAHGSKEITVSALFPLAIENGVDVGDKSEQSQKIRLGKLLKELRDRVFTVPTGDGECQVGIELGGTEHRANLWRLARIGGSGECG
jgi:hypothetical protein